MTEIVAAPLERVAREVAAKIKAEHRCAEPTCWLDVQDENCLASVLAAALAACAREEAKWRLNHWPPLGALITVDSLTSWIRERQEEQVERVAALERAAGEKA